MEIVSESLMILSQIPPFAIMAKGGIWGDYAELN